MSLKTYRRVWWAITVLAVVSVFITDASSPGTFPRIIGAVGGWGSMIAMFVLALIQFKNTQEGKPGFDSEE